VGKEACKKLGKKYATLGALDADLPDAPGLTRPARAALEEWLKHYSTRCLLNELRALGVACAQEHLPAADEQGEGAAAGAAAAGTGGGGAGSSSVLAGLNVVVTGE
jgi:hypothetical protein